MSIPMLTTPDVNYPDSDGKPVADNTKQYRWIVTIHGNLDCMYAADDHVFVAADLLWYPVEGQPRICTASDVLVAFDRPKGDRGSYRQWLENHQPPDVMFEIRSPCNTDAELEQKLAFYDRHGVREYYLYDPDTWELCGWQRVDGCLQPIVPIDNWISPLLGIRFELPPGQEMVIYAPDGRRFWTFVELMQHSVEAHERAEVAQERAAKAQERAAKAQEQAAKAQERAAENRRTRELAERQAEDAQRQAEETQRRADEAQRQTAFERSGKEEAQRRVEDAQRRAEALAARLRALGLNPDE
jgi:Uma2 family endonuclease